MPLRRRLVRGPGAPHSPLLLAGRSLSTAERSERAAGPVLGACCREFESRATVHPVPPPAPLRSHGLLPRPADGNSGSTAPGRGHLDVVGGAVLLRCEEVQHYVDDVHDTQDDYPDDGVREMLNAVLNSLQRRVHRARNADSTDQVAARTRGRYTAAH
eukprot:1813538-Rhodomonas_salina.1